MVPYCCLLSVATPHPSKVFSEKKSLNLFQDKTLRIRRLYDKKRKTLVYVAYSTRLSTASVSEGGEFECDSFLISYHSWIQSP